MGAVIPPAEVRVEPGREHLGQHPGRVSAAMHPAHETRMHVAVGVRQDVRA